MLDLFRTPWPELDLGDLETFLSDAGEEGVTWEAKAGDADGRLRTDAIRKASCGLANQIGGYLILGAEHEEESGWQLPGIVVPGGEPERWCGQVIRDLSPAPRFAAKSWKLSGDRVAIVARVEPSAEPPCMTSQGRVFERVSGETLPVTDPALLSGLFQRGQQARGRAEQFAQRAAERAIVAPGWRSQRAVAIAVSLAPVGRETDDISSRLFTEATREAVVKSVWALLGDVRPEDIETRQEQDAFTALAHVGENREFGPGGAVKYIHRHSWFIQASWDGAVAAGVWLSDGAVERIDSPEAVISSCWKEIDAVAVVLGGYGPAHLDILVHVAQSEEVEVHGTEAFAPGRLPPQHSLYASLPERTRLGRVVDLGDIDAEALRSLDRELNRAAGTIADEPGPTQEGEAV